MRRKKKQLVNSDFFGGPDYQSIVRAGSFYVKSYKLADRICISTRKSWNTRRNETDLKKQNIQNKMKEKKIVSLDLTNGQNLLLISPVR